MNQFQFANLMNNLFLTNSLTNRKEPSTQLTRKEYRYMRVDQLFMISLMLEMHER